MSNKTSKLIFKLLTVIATILIIIFVIYGFSLGIFKDKFILIDYMKRFGIFAPIFFIVLQAFQVVLPVIPGGASCFAGVLAFGGVLGFIYNYIGLIIGSIIVFLLSRKYGIKIMNKIFSKETLDKYLPYLEDKRFEMLFFFIIFLPGLPDDIFCYIAGLSKIKLSKFIIILLIGKPLTLLAYSIFITLI